MRLTLRALLAYLNNVLEPADADEFAAKVQESAVASGLVQRISGITHKMRMNAPRVDAKGMADDANNVAEYLDNSLSEERVGDFERACINSDVHLAEVASSYQILTMVLGRKADISESLRRRIYTLPLDIATGSKPGGEMDAGQKQRLKKTMEKMAQAAKEQDAAVRTSATHPVPQVPDYLRRGEGSFARWLALAAVLFVAALLAIAAAGPFDASNKLIGWMFPAPTEVAQGEGDNSPDDQSNQGPRDESSDKNSTEPQRTSEPDPDASDDQESKANVTPVEPDTKADEEKNAATSTEPPQDDAAPSTTNPDEPETRPEAVAKEAPAVAADAAAETKTAPDATAPTDDKPADPPAPMDVGRYASDDQVLARYDAEDRMWMRVRPRAVLTAGERLVVLPTYRPQITLASGVQVTFAGASEVQLEQPPAEGVSRMTVDYGRFLVVTPGEAGARLDLNLHGIQGTLTLVDPETVVAVDVRRYLPPGADPEQENSRQLVVELFAANGTASWTPAEKEAIAIPRQHVLSYVALSEPQLAGPFEAPDWIDAGGTPDIDRITSIELQKPLDLEKPVHVRLQELMSDRRVDVRALASRCLTSLGEFEPIIEELSNSQQKAFWAAEVQTLREALARGVEEAALIRQTLETLRPEVAETMYRLLWGYSAEQLEGGADKELMALLESPEMDVRVLVIDTLREITDAQLLYRPEKSPADNRASILRWNQLQAKGGVVYKEPPSPLPALKPLPPPMAEAKAGGRKGPARAKEGIE